MSQPDPIYAYCERVSATPTSVVHIRHVGEEGLKPSGGAPDTTLCGAELHRGWDLTSEVDFQSVRRTSLPTIEHGRTCKQCADTYLGQPRDDVVNGMPRDPKEQFFEVNRAARRRAKKKRG